MLGGRDYTHTHMLPQILKPYYAPTVNLRPYSPKPEPEAPNFGNPQALNPKTLNPRTLNPKT